jgi:hypothetical protein
MNDLIITTKQNLRLIAKTINALQLQITQLESQVRKLRLNLLGGKQ